MMIFIQNIATLKFFAGDSGWSENPDTAHAFPNAVAALNFAAVQPRSRNLMMHFGTPHRLVGSIAKAAQVAKKAKSIFFWKGPVLPRADIGEPFVLMELSSSADDQMGQVATFSYR